VIAFSRPEFYLPGIATLTCFPQAPELCVEVLSPSNTEAKLAEKAALYFDAGAREVWICASSGTMKFLARGAARPLKTSRLCPALPKRIELP
jgi:hypothetical protein